jgi:hypothetical protein
MQLSSAEGGLMSSVDPADVDFASARSIDVTDLNDAVLRQLAGSDAHPAGAEKA